MLYFMAVWILLLAVCGLVGAALLNRMRADRFERMSDRFIAAEWLGIVTLSVTLLAVSLILPLSPVVGASVVVGLGGLSLICQRTRTELLQIRSRLSGRVLLTGLGLAISIAALTTQQVTWIDTGLYHYQIIQWLAKFGAVPGITLLFSNLGFTSSWFALAAPFNAEVFDSRASAIANGFVLLLAALHFLVCCKQSFKGTARLSDWFAIAFLGIVLPIVFGLKLISEILISASPDFPAIFLVGVVAWTVLVAFHHWELESRQKHALDLDIDTKNIHTKNVDTNASVIPLFLSAGAVTIKLTAIPLLLVSGFCFVVSQRSSIRRIFMGGAIVMLISLPLVTSGTITSGCPLYPSSIACLDLPWSLKSQEIENVVAGTHQWTTWYPSPQSGANGLLWLVGQWVMTSNLNKVMALLMVISAALAIWLAKTLVKNREFSLLWVGAIGIVGILFIMLTSPFFRFGLPYITLLPALFIAILCRYRFGSSFPIFAGSVAQNFLKPTLSVAHLLSLSLATLAIVITVNQSPFQLLLPPPLKLVQTVQKQTNDIFFQMPIEGLCWATKIPCAFEVKPEINLRNPAQGIQAGFVRAR